MSSRILCCASGGSFNIRIPTKLGRTELQGSNPGETTEIMMLSTESTEFELCGKINDLLSDLGQTPEAFTGRICLCQCSMTSPATEMATKLNVWQMPESSKYLREDLC